MSEASEPRRRASILKSVLLAPLRFLGWCCRSKLRLAGLTLLVFLLLGLGSFTAYGYWSSPGFCRSCHLMEDYYQSWEHSPHREVTCVKCHFEPGIENELHGKWVAIKQLAATVTGAYSSMPYAEVSDNSCLRSGCHERGQLERPVDFSERGIKFDHTGHLGEMRRGIKLACTSCHHQRLLTTHMDVDKSTCFLCHFKEAETADGKRLGDCATCHGPPHEEKQAGKFQVVHADLQKRGMQCAQCHVEVKAGTGKVDKSRCFSCHNRPEQIDRLGDSALLHVEHVTKHKLHCYQCHELIEHEFSNDITAHQQDNCASCHENSHTAPAQLYTGRGAKGVLPAPDPMHDLGLDCVACHQNAHGAGVQGNGAVHGTTRRAGVASCRSCHADRYDEFVVAVGKSSEAMLAWLEKRAEAASKALAGRNGSRQLVDPEVYRAFSETQFNLAFVRRAVPIHNPIYAVEILRRCNARLEEVEESLGIEVEGDVPEGFAREECGVCHDSLQEPQTIDLGNGRKYPHPVHVEETGLECADCHVGDKHPPKAATQETACAACHKK